MVTPRSRTPGRATPLEVTLVNPTELRILWEDGHESAFDADFLRLQCRCRACVSQGTGLGMVVWALTTPEGYDPPPVTIQHVKVVGGLALGLSFSDGHEDALFTFDHLRSICPCEGCAGRS